MRSKQIGVLFILICVMANFVSQIYFDTLSKTTLLDFDFHLNEIGHLISILLQDHLFYLAFLFYALSAIFWLLGLKKLTLSMAFSMTSLNYILITLYSFYFLNEGITVSKILSCIFITSGIIVMNKHALLIKKR